MLAAAASGRRQASLTMGPIYNKDHWCSRVREHHLDPLRRIRGVERHVGAAGLEDAEEGHHQLGERAGAPPRPCTSGPTPAAASRRARGAGAALELAVAQVDAGPLDGDGVRGAAGLGGEQLVEPCWVGGRLGRRVPLDEHLVALGTAFGGELRQPPLRLDDRRRQQALEAPQQPLGGRRVVEVGVVDQRLRQAAGGLFEGEAQVEMRRHPIGGDRLDLDAGERQRLDRRVLQREHDLEQGRAAEAPLGRQLVDQFLERQVLVGVGASAVAAPGRAVRRRSGCR